MTCHRAFAYKTREENQILPDNSLKVSKLLMANSLVLVSSTEFKSEQHEATLFLNAWSNLSKIVTDCVMRHLVRNT